MELAKERVAIRTKNHGHFVEDNVIDSKWKDGYKNINHFYSSFDYLLFIDNSTESIPTFLFEMFKTNSNEFSINKLTNQLPEYTKRRLPAIFELIQTEI